ncbi:zinc finger protein schnurri isoform X2 [Amblyomma americanum]
MNGPEGGSAPPGGAMGPSLWPRHAVPKRKMAVVHGPLVPRNASPGEELRPRELGPPGLAVTSPGPCADLGCARDPAAPSGDVVLPGGQCRGTSPRDFRSSRDHRPSRDSRDLPLRIDVGASVSRDYLSSSPIGRLPARETAVPTRDATALSTRLSRDMTRGDSARPKDATSPICNTVMSASSCSTAVVTPVTPPTVTGCSGDVNMPSTVYGSSPGRKLEDTLAGLRLAPPRESVLVRGPGLSAARPQVTSPQILEQHISKIISENAAIVETLDPLWTKRYMRHSSSGSNSSSSSSVSGSSGDSRSGSLGGGSNSTRKWSLDPSAIGSRGRSNPRRVSESALVRTSLSPSTAVAATSAATAPTSTVVAPPPDAPDGSIIRDLLLRHRGEGGAEGACPKCGIWFRSAATLEVHLEHYCKAPNPPPKKRKISEPVLSSHHAAAASRFQFPPVSTRAADDMMTGHVNSVGASGSSRSNSVSFLPGPPAGLDKMPGPPPALPPPAALPPLPPLLASSPPSLSPPVLTATPPVVTAVPTTSLLAPPLRANRPTSLALGGGASTLVGSTLVSPETPRPKKTCLQLYINGHAYTYLGLKCSTRSTYCCIYRPQPMYVAQEAAPPGLSMYSDWRVVPVAEPVPGVAHVRLLKHYDSRQWLHSGTSCTTMSPCGAAAPLVTHSSYWLFRSRAPPKEASQSTAMESDASAASPKASVQEPVPSSEAPVVMESMESVPVTNVATAEHAQVVQSVVPSVPVPTMPQAAPLLPPTLVPPPVPPAAPVPAATSSEGPGSPMETEPLAAPKEDATPTPADESRNGTSGSPKRVRIFEGGFKSNEAYTYVRGRGRGKYVCEECGIRCKKPSMLKKHIRTHTDLRPFSCHHCCFAFKTKGNLTKHMKSKAHHKKCTELGILPVPTTVDDSTQVDPDTLARQEQQQRERPASEDDEEEEEEEEEEEDDDDEEEEEEEEEEDDEGAPIGLLAVVAPPPVPQPMSSGLPPPSVSCSIPVITLTGPPDSVSPLMHPPAAAMTATCQVSEEQEAARSLLHLSAHVPDASWPSDGAPTMPSTSRASPISASAGPTTSLMVGPAAYVGAGSSGNPGTSAELTPPEPGSWPQGGLPWLSSPPAGHRPRSFSMEMHERAAGIAEAEPTRRYSMSSLGRHPDEGPMDLSTARQRRLEILPGGFVSGHNVRSYAREGGLLGACLELGGTAPPLPQGHIPAAAGTSSESGGTSSGCGGGGAGEEGRCGICHKSFARASQLRMHVNIHYFERPFRCEACAVSFRTRGHLQKHRRSVGHYNRLNMNLAFGAPSADNPRPFKCADCQIAFRIHGHLAKHLRSKMHILKLECLGKLPFGMYAEMERSGVNLNEIDTSDCDNSLESLQVMAQKLYQGGEPVASPLDAAMDEISPLRGEASPPQVVEGPPPTCWESGALRPCPLCGRLLKSAKSLQVHLHCDHPSGVGLQPDEEGGAPEVPPPALTTPWPCSICQKVFPSQALLQQHFVSHTQPRPYVCDQCDAGFTSALLLANHVANSHPAADNILPPRVPLVQSPVLSTV